MAKKALGHLQFMVNGLRSTPSTKPDINMKFYSDVLRDAPPNVAAWYHLCLKHKRKKTIERIYGLHFEGTITKCKVAIYLKANGIGPIISTQQDLMKRTLEDPAFKDLSFWPPSGRTLISPEAAPDPSTAPEPPALTTITTPVEMEIDQQGKISNMYYCKFCIMDERNIILLHYILNLEIAKISNTYCSKFCIIAKRNILFLCYIFNLETARQVVVVEVQSREEHPQTLLN